MAGVTVAVSLATELVQVVLGMLSFEFYLSEGQEEENNHFFSSLGQEMCFPLEK